MRSLEVQELELEREAFRRRIMREASIAFAAAAAEGPTARRPAEAEPESCQTCGGEGWIDDPAHPIGGSYEDFLAAGPPKWIDCPDCAARALVPLQEPKRQPQRQPTCRNVGCERPASDLPLSMGYCSRICLEDALCEDGWS
jgi:hypothetical protein